MPSIKLINPVKSKVMGLIKAAGAPAYFELPKYIFASHSTY